MSIVCGALAVPSLLAGPTAAAAAFDARQVQIIAKVFRFLDSKPAPGAELFVADGAADPAAVQSVFSNMRVSGGNSGGSAAAFAVLVVTPAQAQAAKAANPRALTIGNDAACVDSGDCIIAVETQPRVTIYLSRSAAAAAGVSFDTSFRMLMTER